MTAFVKSLGLIATVGSSLLMHSYVHATESKCTINNDEIKQLIQLHNESRQADGKAALKVSCKLNKAALAHSKYMAKKGRLSHKGSKGSSVGKRAKKSGYQWRTIAENIAHGFSSPQDTYEGWLNSPPHQHNIMNPSYTEIGAAQAENYWTVVLAQPKK